MNTITTGKPPIGTVPGLRDAVPVVGPRKVGEVLHATGELEEAIGRVQAALETLSNRLSAVLEAEVLCPAQGGTDTPEASSELGRRLRAVWTQLMGVEKHIGSVTARIQL